MVDLSIVICKRLTGLTVLLPSLAPKNLPRKRPSTAQQLQVTTVILIQRFPELLGLLGKAQARCGLRARLPGTLGTAGRVGPGLEEMELR